MINSSNFLGKMSAFGTKQTVVCYTNRCFTDIFLAFMAKRIAENKGKDIYALDLQLYLLQPLLLNGFDNGGLDFASFALNPYNNSSVVNIKGQWCYELEQDICLPEMH